MAIIFTDTDTSIPFADIHINTDVYFLSMLLQAPSTNTRLVSVFNMITVETSITVFKMGSFEVS